MHHKLSRDREYWKLPTKQSQGTVNLLMNFIKYLKKNSHQFFINSSKKWNMREYFYSHSVGSVLPGYQTRHHKNANHKPIFLNKFLANWIQQYVKSVIHYTPESSGMYPGMQGWFNLQKSNQCNMPH